METERARNAASVVKFKCFLDVPVCARVQRVYPLYRVVHLLVNLG